MPSSAVTTAVTLDRILRVAIAGCFIGHGAFGIITKEGWLAYFAVAHISEPLAWQLMPWIGAMDILIGIAALISPRRAVMTWAVGWALWTASLRPLAGESIWELLERAGNYGAPLALLVLCGVRGAPGGRLAPPTDAPTFASRASHLALTLRLATALLLLGHAGCNLLDHKPAFQTLHAAILPTAGLGTQLTMGGIDLVLALAVLILPRPALLLAITLWKLATESLWIVAGYPLWEFIERFGSYGVPLAYAWLLHRTNRRFPEPGA